MVYGCASLVEWGFIIPREKLYPLFRILRELAGKPLPADSSDSEAETSKATEASGATEEVQGPPAEKRKLSDDDLDEMLELIDAAMKKADGERAKKEKADKGEAEKEKADKESPEDVESNLQETIVTRRVLDKHAGGTIACHYFLRRLSGDRYVVDQWGHPEDYELLSVGMGKTLSLEGNEEVAEGMGHRLREALRFKEAGIKVEDQWILMLIPM